MKIAIVGGTGTLGRRVTSELQARGHEVRALSRHVLAVAGVSPPARDDLIGQYRNCAIARITETDPTANPAACRLTSPPGIPQAKLPAVLGILQGQDATVQADTFGRGFRIGLAYETALALLATFLMVLIPKRARPQEL